MRRFFVFLVFFTLTASLIFIGYAMAAYVMTSPISDVVTVQPALTPPEFEWGPGW